MEDIFVFFEHLQSLYADELYEDVKLFAELLNGESDDPKDKYIIYYYHGNAAFHLKEYRLAESIFCEALELNKLNLSETSSEYDCDTDIEIKYSLHLCYMQDKRYQDALSILESIPIRQRSLKILLALGKICELLSFNKEAIDFYIDILQTSKLPLVAIEALQNLGVPLDHIPKLSETLDIEWLQMYLRARDRLHSREYMDSNGAQSTYGVPRQPPTPSEFDYPSNQIHTQNQPIPQKVQDINFPSFMSDGEDASFLKPQSKMNCVNRSRAGNVGVVPKRNKQYLDSIFIKDGKEVTFMKPVKTKLKVPEQRDLDDDSYGDSCLLPKLQYVSMHLDEDYDKNTSLAIDGLAMKYLSNNRLASVAKKFNKKGSKLKDLNHIDEDEEANHAHYGDYEANGRSRSETLANFNNNISFASTAYLQKHGLMKQNGTIDNNGLKPDLNHEEINKISNDSSNVLSKPKNVRKNNEFKKVLSQQNSNEQHYNSNNKPFQAPQQPQTYQQQAQQNLGKNSPKCANPNVPRKEKNGLPNVSDENYEERSHILDFSSIKKLPKFL